MSFLYNLFLVLIFAIIFWVMQGFSFCFRSLIESFLTGMCLSMMVFILEKNFSFDRLTSFLSSSSSESQSTSNSLEQTHL